MAIQLFGDPYNLQGGSTQLQGGVNPQTTFNPQQPATTQQTSVAPTPTTSVAPSTTSSVLTAQPKTLNSLYSPYIGTRPSSVNPSVLEYYNKENNLAFPDQTTTLAYASTIAGFPLTDLRQLEAPVDTGVSTPAYTQPSAPAPTQNPTDPNQSLAEQAAKAGLSLDEYLKLVGGGSLTQDEKNAIDQELGIPGLESTVFSPPSKSTEQLYNDAYAAAGLANLSAQIKSKIDEINKAHQNFTEASGVINENPWLSENSRVGRVSRLQDKAQLQIGNLNNELAQLEDLYNSGLTEVNNLVARQSADFSTNQQLNAQKLQYLLGKAQDRYATAQEAKTASAYKYLPDYLKARAAAQKPDVIGSAESGYYRWNPDTGTFEQVIAPQVTPNFQANPVTGELFNTKTGQSLSGGSFSGAGSFPAGAQTPGSAAAVNNPLGIKPGGKFAQYATPEQGFQAGVDLVRKYQTAGPAGMNANSTLDQMIKTWITGDPNSTRATGYNSTNVAQYLATLGVSGVTPNTPIGQIDTTALAAAIAHFETGYTIGGASQLGNSTIDNLVKQVLSNPQIFSNLSSAQQNAVTARMAQVGIPIPAAVKPATDTQNQAATYATRVQQAGTILDGLQSSIASYNPLLFEAELRLPSYLQSSEFQQYQQAARNLVNAILRRESGAAISSGEFENAYQQYLPRAGDSAATLAQKKQNRDAILNGLIQSAGPAYSSSSYSSGSDLSQYNL